MVTLADVRDFFTGADCASRPDLLQLNTKGYPRADFFLNAAQRHLDSLIDNPTSRCRLHIPVPANAYYITAEDCRTVEEVWFVNNSDVTLPLQNNQRTKLGRLAFDKFRLTYPTLVPMGVSGLIPLISQLANASTCTGNPPQLPGAWALMTLIAPPRRQVPIGTSDIYNSSSGLEGMQLGTGALGLTGVVFGPASQVAGTIEINGIFDSPRLESDNDVSFWTLKHPEILAFCACWFLETSYRNTEGAKAWEISYKTLLMDIDRDMVAQESAGVTGIDVRYRSYESYTTFQTPRESRVQQGW